MTVEIVSGPPCSGKTTYVRNHIGNNDIVFDYDAIYEAVTYKERDSELTEMNSEFIGRLRYEFVYLTREIDSKPDTLYVIATTPTTEFLEMVGEHKEHKISATREQCYDNLANDDSRPDKEMEKQRIDRYFDAIEAKRMSKLLDREIRSFSFDVAAVDDEQHGTHLEGRPIVYNARTDLGMYDEVIEAGALNETDLRDVRFLINHNTDMIPLARSRRNNENSTMQLSPDAEGMGIRVDLDVENNSEARALYSSVQRGDITGMSFMFTVNGDEWENLDSEHPTRHIRSIGHVFEVSAVTFPAYEQTSIEARSAALESARAEALERAKAEDAEKRRKEILKRLEVFD